MPNPRPPLHRVADATLLYPVVVLVFLYGEWLLAWAVLGHPPLPSWNDPKSIPVAGWLHTLTGFVLLGGYLALSASLVVNPVLGLLPRFSPQRITVRILAALACWGSLFVLLRWDPGRVLEWWLD